jgi:PAS domain S-box-containing protein
MSRNVPKDADEAQLAYRRLVEQIPAITYTQVADPASPTGFRDVYISPQTKSILGYTAEEWRADPELWIKCTHPEDLDRVLHEERASAGGSTVFRSEYRMIARDGRIVWFRDEASPVIDLGTGSTFWQGMMLDITAEKLAQEEVEASEQRWRQLVETLPAVVFIDSADDAVTNFYTSSYSEQMLGYTAEDWQSDPDFWFNVIHPDDRERIREANHRHQEGMFDEVYRLIAKEGRVVWVRDVATIIPGDKGAEPTSLGFFFDVTAEKEQEEALRASEERYRLVVENAQDMIAVFDLEGTLLYASPSGEQVLGWSLDEMIGSTAVSMLTHPDDLELAASAIVKAVGGEPTSAQVRVRHKDGSWHYIEGVASPISSGNGHTVSIMLIARDVTLRKAAEEAIARADTERRRFLSELVEAQEAERGRIAKDLSEDAIQLITALSIRLQALRRPAGPPQEADDLQRMAEAVDDAVIRLRRLLFELLPPALARDGLAAGLQQYLEVAAEPGRRTWHVDNRLNTKPPTEIRLIAYRIVQEAVRSARPDLYRGETQVVLEGRDNGLLVRIAPKDQEANGFDEFFSEEAVSSMDQRAQVAGGWCRVRHGADEGTVLELWLPSG